MHQLAVNHDKERSTSGLFLGFFFSSSALFNEFIAIPLGESLSSYCIVY